ncbi:hypothetical protein GCM10010455_19470 [Microbacterium esteraromaticum]
MFRRQIRIHVDRDSVAAGDDMRSHAADVTARRGSRLSEIIDGVTPDVRVPGWSWVVIVDRETAAVWSVDGGIRMLVPDRTVTAESLDVFFRYFMQIDADWLLARLAEGARPNRDALTAEWQRSRS